MPKELKTIGELEREKGVVILGDINPNEKISKEDFKNLLLSPLNYVGVNYEDRIKFLKDNGYEVNRANLTDWNLSTKPTVES